MPTVPELVTFKPVNVATTSPTVASTKVRRTAGDMETDVSVDVIVLPVEDKERKGEHMSDPRPLNLGQVKNSRKFQKFQFSEIFQKIRKK